MTRQSLLKVMEITDIDLVPYEELYKHFHSHPELSLQERETAATAASHLRKLNAGFEIHTDIGGHGLAGVLRNGEGKTVLLRADMDALPVEEDTGLSYASKATMRDSDGVVKPVMHACGHDMHVTCLLAAAEQLSRIKFAWSGTLIVVFQPNEERAGGAQAMIDDGLYSKIPIPDIVLGQHVMADRAGHVGSKLGTIMAAADSFKITIYGRGGHGSMPHRTIDPVVMAANIVIRLQTIVSREVNPSDMAVVTVGALQAGQTENIINDKAEIKVNVRTINTETRERVLKAIKRIVKAECEASNSPKEPLIENTSTFPMTVNNKEITDQLAASFADVFPSFDADAPRVNASEDFSILGTAVDRPTSFWFFGGVDPEKWDEKEKEGRLVEDIPVNHSPFFAPVVQPTLRTGVRALCVGAMTFLTRRIL
jgi:amidohydrolase